MRRYIPIDTNNIPDNFDIEVGGGKYFIRIDYNEVADYYNITVLKDGKALLSGEPLLLNNLVGSDIPNRDLPADDLMVMDESGQAEDAGLIYMGDTVQIYIDEIDPNGSETDNPDVEPLGYDPDEGDDSDMEGTVVL